MRQDFIFQIRTLEEALNYERNRSEELQGKLDKVLRLDIGENKVQGEVKLPLRQTASPMRQKFTAESESRRKYWAEQIKKTEERDRAREVVTSSTTIED